MYKFARLYASNENFMSDLYTKEKVDELNVLCKGDKKLIGLHLWKSFPVATKKSMFSSTATPATAKCSCMVPGVDADNPDVCIICGLSATQMNALVFRKLK